MRTILYLLRHAATANNLAHPALLQGRRQNPPLHSVGEMQARVTAEFLAVRPLDAVYSSPMLRALQTAQILAAPHKIKPVAVQSLIECDIGDWEGQSWEEIKENEPGLYDRFMANPAVQGYKGGENFQQVLDRTRGAIEEIITRHAGKAVLVVSHHIVNRVYLADLLGLGAAKARKFSLDNCSISLVVNEKGKTGVQVLNSNFHLQGVA
ncbi:histidine phosphatase family protein [Telmatocola sphagniphila]|uniref:Histidine phosphatase family protein n=1 Tax=Telmatocola sphagniphila TaxID=1123043 RepID=A0A8E6B652_9BACT|nr:histidine phosphatase family protein [Telmatocola sphagniphila]QVL32087.1 histidine phosphatase family protein [Telmatocola sphagniphila]